jgi:predicted lipoprotein with Yx(FWY)xxD motif
MKRIAALAIAAATLALAAGCGSGGGKTSAASTSATSSAPTRSAATAPKAPAGKAAAGAKGGASVPGTLVKVRASEFGRVLVDGRGQALYLFSRDGRGPSRCSGACADAWPPLYSSGRPVAGSGASAAKLGTVPRAGGHLQVTYAGQPLYLYHADTPTKILCQDVDEFGGKWLVVKPSGAPLR